jgi:hypothetical protein
MDLMFGLPTRTKPLGRGGCPAISQWLIQQIAR